MGSAEGGGEPGGRERAGSGGARWIGKGGGQRGGMEGGAGRLESAWRAWRDSRAAGFETKTPLVEADALQTVGARTASDSRRSYSFRQ